MKGYLTFLWRSLSISFVGDWRYYSWMLVLTAVGLLSNLSEATARVRAVLGYNLLRSKKTQCPVGGRRDNESRSYAWFASQSVAQERQNGGFAYHRAGAQGDCPGAYHRAKSSCNGGT